MEGRDDFRMYVQNPQVSGLYTIYYAPHYIDHYDPGERVVAVATNETVNLDLADDPIVGEIKDNIAITWNGKLLVPSSGDYHFLLNADDGAALWIDDTPVIDNYWNSFYNRDQWNGLPLHLEKGEHKIQVNFNEVSGAARCVLKWYAGGIIPEWTLIPASQFIPEPIELPAPWLGERTFNQMRKGHVSFNKTEKTITLWGGGTMFEGESEGFHYLWTQMRGNFEFCLKYQYHDSHETCKLMLMVRTSLENGAPLVTSNIEASGPNGTLSSQIRSVQDGKIGFQAEGISASNKGWIKLTRYGSRFSFYWKENENDEWQEICAPYTDSEAAFRGPLYVGPAVTTPNWVGVHAFTLSRVSLKVPIKGSLLLLR